ncbi:MAG TPA: Na+/H+ antiporter [Gemmatimonadaceae bacterium]|nr:Na+/H+ antiporter [Gemmatimonadaceae bacterium]
MVEIVIFLLIIAAGLEMLSRRIGVPRPILLVIAGTLLAFVPAAPTVRVDPDVVFFIFLPPLLYWAAINTSYREFRRNGVDIMLLAVGLVVATAAVVAAVAHAMFAMLSWPAAFALGAAVGPTDAVAATAVMRRFGVPRTLVSILEGESLVNDATSLVIFEMAVTAGDTGQFSLGPALLSFLWAAGGGIIFGLAAGWCIASLRRWIGRTSERSPVLESSISLLTPYVAFLAADRAGVSGVLAVVVAGLYLGHASARLLTAPSRIQAINMWEIVDFLLEGLLFIFVGLGLPLALGAVRAGGEGTLSNLIATAAVVSVAVIVLRLAWVFPAAYAPRYFRRRFTERKAPYPPWQNVFFVGWAGLRGAVSLVLALSVPFVTASGAPFPGRDVVIFVTFVVILVTLVGQGLTLRPLIRVLGLEPDRADAFEETNARLQTAQAALARLAEIEARQRTNETDGMETGLPPEIGNADARVVLDALRNEYTHRVHLYSNEVRTRSIPPPDPNGEPDVPDDDAVEADLDGRRAGSYRALRLATLDAERQRLIRMRDEGEISDGVLHRVERDLDLEQSLLTGWAG